MASSSSSSITQQVLPHLFKPNPDCLKPVAKKPDKKPEQKKVEEASKEAFASASSAFRPFVKKPVALSQDKPLHKVTKELAGFHNSLQNYRYNIEKKPIGEGAYSEVFRALETHSGKTYAIKTMLPDELSNCAGMREFRVLRRLQSVPHVVKMHNCFTVKTGCSICLVFELLPGSLFEKRLSIAALAKLTKQLVETMAKLQSLGVLHGDLTPANMSYKGGILTIFDWNLTATQQSMSEGALIQTSFYRAPEVFLRKPYGVGVVSWNIGVLLYELYVGKVLFPSDENNETSTFFASIFPYLGPVPKAWMENVSPEIKNLFKANDSGDYCSLAVAPFEKNLPPSFTLIDERIVSAALHNGEATYPLVPHLIDFLQQTVRYEKRLNFFQMLQHPFIKSVF